MTWCCRAWFLVAILAALAPAGLRLMLASRPASQPIDQAMAQAGEKLFKHVWTSNDPLTPDGDGIGPVFNGRSCVECHHQGGPGGSGGLNHNVTAFTVVAPSGKSRDGIVHAHASSPRYQETLQQVHPALPPLTQPPLDKVLMVAGTPRGQTIPMPTGVTISQRNTPALFGAKLIDEIPDQVILANERAERLQAGLANSEREDLPVGRAARLADGRLGRFGWKAQTASLSEFVQGACAGELGLSNPGHSQPKPLNAPNYQSTGLDLTQEQCDQLTAFTASLPRPAERLPADSAARDQAAAGKQVFVRIGCAACHTPDLGSVEGIYSDLLLHHMGKDLVGGSAYYEPPHEVPQNPSSDGPQPDEWRTPPLWGVADSAPYLHDGRAPTLQKAIEMHGGQGTRAARRFAELRSEEQNQVVAFLKNLRAP